MKEQKKESRASVFLAVGFFRILLYIFVFVLIIWIGKSTFSFGYDVFNQKAMSPGNGKEVTVEIKEGASVYEIGKALERKNLIEDAKVFVVQEKLSRYRGKIKPGSYVVSTAYTPDRILAVLSGEDSQEEETP